MQLSTYIYGVFGTVLVVATINDVRAAHKLRPLRVDTTLVRAARAYSTTLIGRNTFSHGALGPRLAAHGVRGPWIGIGARIGTFSGYAGATVVTADFAGS